MENKKNLNNLTDEQIDGSTIKGGAGRIRPSRLGGTPNTPGTPDFSNPQPSPENSLPGQNPETNQPDPLDPNPHPAHPPL